jgi:formylglycine-generating enzyme required for sulfatase activity
MASRHLEHAWIAVALAGACLRCGSGSDAPRGQVVLFIDTDAPIASQSLVPAEEFKRDASVDTLRIDILDDQDRPIRGKTRQISASDLVNWPVSFGLESSAEAKLARLRLRAFRARFAEARTDPDTQAQLYEPVAGYTIDRVVEVPLPEKGAFGLRVVLHAQCRGKRPDFVRRTTCVDDPDPLSLGSFRSGLEVLPTGSERDPNALPARPLAWWPGSQADCPAGPPAQNDATRVCIPGGFFMLGNLRVVGFGALKRSDAVPAHPVVMRPFRIDRTEVTLQRYWDKIGPTAPNGKSPECTANLGAPQLPLNCVTWDEAQDICTKMGGRLPTEAEWEYVASGRGRGFLFPWGDEPPDCNSASMGHGQSAAGFEQCGLLSGPEPVASYTDKRPGGKDAIVIDDPTNPIVDMAGSVSEWMLDSFKPYDEDTSCWERDSVLTHPFCYKQAVAEHSVRGGNWSGQMEVAYVALRNNQSTDRYPSVGFRCVYPLVGAANDPILDPKGSNAKEYAQYFSKRR